VPDLEYPAARANRPPATGPGRTSGRSGRPLLCRRRPTGQAPLY